MLLSEIYRVLKKNGYFILIYSSKNQHATGIKSVLNLSKLNFQIDDENSIENNRELFNNRTNNFKFYSTSSEITCPDTLLILKKC